MKLRERLFYAFRMRPVTMRLCAGLLALAVLAGAFLGISATLDP